MEIEQITNLSSEDIEKLSLNEKEKFEEFKRHIDNYNQSLQNIRLERSKYRNAVNQKKSYDKTLKKDISRKVYIHEVGPILLIGILSFYLILKSNDLDAMQSYIKILIFLLDITIIFCALFFPLLILPRTSWEN